MSLINLDELNSISVNLDSVEMSQSCNVRLLERLAYELPLSLPFSFAECLVKQSEYRLWCSIRADVLSKIRQIQKGVV